MVDTVVTRLASYRFNETRFLVLFCVFSPPVSLFARSFCLRLIVFIDDGLHAALRMDNGNVIGYHKVNIVFV